MRILEISATPSGKVLRGWIYADNLLFHGTKVYDLRQVCSYYRPRIPLCIRGHRTITIGHRTFVYTPDEFTPMVMAMESKQENLVNADIIEIHNNLTRRIKT